MVVGVGGGGGGLVADVYPLLFNAATDRTQISIYFDICPSFVKYIKTNFYY